jgi:hypothetical protein
MLQGQNARAAKPLRIFFDQRSCGDACHHIICKNSILFEFIIPVVGHPDIAGEYERLHATQDLAHAGPSRLTAAAAHHLLLASGRRKVIPPPPSPSSAAPPTACRVLAPIPLFVDPESLSLRTARTRGDGLPQLACNARSWPSPLAE